MGSKPPSDQSPGVGPQLRSHGPVVQQCSVCRHSLEACLCATPSTSAGLPARRTRPRKRPPQSEREEAPPTARRQLFSESRARHSCPHCPKSFGSPGKLSQHLYSHTGERPFVCQHCSKAFSSRFKLVRHALIHSDTRQYRCNTCGRTFHRKDHLKNHSKVHSPLKQRFKCDREGCGKEYSSPISFRKHVAVHAAEDGNLECTICNKVCATKEEIVLHLKIHAGSRTVKTQADRKYRCEYCERSFFTGKDVRRHLVVHTGRRDFLCQFCPQRFGRKDHLVRHIKKSHNHGGKKGKKKADQKTKSVTAILEEASTSRLEDEELPLLDVKSESRSSLGMFDDEEDDETNLPASSEIFKADSETLRQIGQPEELLSETSGSMMSDTIYQSPPPPYPHHMSSLDPGMSYEEIPRGSSSEVIDIKAEEFITLLPHQFPPNLLLTTADESDPLPLSIMSGSHFMEVEEEQSLSRQILQMSGPSQGSSSDADLVIPGFLSPGDTPSSSTPLPGFNQAFQQNP
ncbi:zinc finger protein PLAGL1-like [Macrosteles quadrilineatus]|uniref:zinc finger protein PLAGL1-like n=1 Tax=Macrosteles quadrilineatus TaxID=74068 RepID=UPI0023E13F77|nr:zinc finger protein PLAGL1-like [Macrosteles quadrilineatus]